MEKICLAFLWHMHQPYYKNLFTGEYLLPWVLLHGTKDYLDMACLLKEFPGLKQNFNVVPSLLKQLVDYEDPHVKDTYLEIMRKRPQDLSEQEKIFLLMNFFNANWENMIRPFPRFYELLKKRGFYYPKEAVKEIVGYFTNEELRDIQVLFFLAWIDPMFFDQYEELQRLKSKGRGFTEEDKQVMEGIQRSILKGIIPLYKELVEAGTIELSTSPFYHPIIPLLIDGAVAREAMPGVPLPEKPFSRPEDASWQIKNADRLFTDVFGFAVKGMWPPEGSVSDEALRLYMEEGVEWLATDEDILYESLRISHSRDGNNFVRTPEILYKPYRYEQGGRAMHVVYRDQRLSDLISFHYSKSEPKEAATDFIRRVKGIGESVRGKVRMPLVTMAMDGENAWENYTHDGQDFLRFLYEGILADEEIMPVTISEYLKVAEDFGTISRTHAGSWIGHNFSIWIGQMEDNMGWSLLAETREFLEKEDPGRQNKDAWESIFIAEGSDWFWWYGDDHSSENDEVFDFLFRENLANVYRFLGKEPAETLAIPILLEDREIRPTREPVNFIYPRIDGRVTNYFDWIGSGFVEGKGHGVAMHDAVALIKGCYYGFNEHSLYIRMDIDRTFMQDLMDVSFEINLAGKTTSKIVYRVKGAVEETTLPVSIAFAEILEMECPLEGLGVKRGETVDIWLSLKVKDMLVDRLPKRGYLSLTVPSETFDTEMWYV
ncbi:MAG: Glycosyl hydrolase family 57 [Syntrophorhabdus sp. PtaU1.Bin050]|nr:MAG: Glycosyl hydrolase family 57 [Syntrophorhabdus sp. PtaU1.Bin050]